MNCTSLERMKLKEFNNLKSIGEKAFMSCTSVNEMNLSGCANLTSIGNDAFDNCVTLKTVDLSKCNKLKNDLIMRLTRPALVALP